MISYLVLVQSLAQVGLFAQTLFSHVSLFSELIAQACSFGLCLLTGHLCSPQGSFQSSYCALCAVFVAILDLEGGEAVDQGINRHVGGAV